MWKILLSTFILIFIAELGDKTQLATMLMAAKCKSLWPVFIGSSLALILSSFIGVIAGGLVNKFIPPQYIQLTAGIGFILIGFLLVFGRI